MFSFNGNKTITSGSGMVVTNSKYAVKRIKYLSTQAKNKKNNLFITKLVIITECLTFMQQ